MKIAGERQNHRQKGTVMPRQRSTVTILPPRGGRAPKNRS